MNKVSIAKIFIVSGIILILSCGCSFKKDAATILISHLRQMEKIFEKNQDDVETLAASLAAYSAANMEAMQNGVKALTDKLQTVKEKPLESFDLLAKVTEISGIIVNIRTKYGHLLDDPKVQKAFADFSQVFGSVQNLGRS